LLFRTACTWTKLRRTRYLFTDVAAILKTVTAPLFVLSIFLKAIIYLCMYRFEDEQSYN